ncbi:mucin-5B-like [Gastrophryne carolinensis]
MGTFKWIPLWVLLGILASVNENKFNQVQGHNEDDNSISEQQENVLITGAPRKVMIPLPTSLSVESFNAAHNNRVCSTWGNFHFKNFDGDLFYFPGTCNYVYASHCQSAYEDFNIQIRRTVVDNVSLIEKISMKLDGLDVQIDSNTVIVGGQRVQLPYGASGVQIEKYGVYLTVTSKLGLTFMWNDDDSLLLELDAKYANSTCGLCGDFNGISMQNEFVINGVQITAEQFGNMQKLDGPTELCTDVSPIPKSNCTDNERICELVLLGSAFSSCHSLMAVEQYIEACIEDLCRCDSKTTPLCLCDTFAEYSRQCAHAGGYPENWRTEDLCSQICPYNMEYQECGSQCADTCTNHDRAVLCEKHCMEGCVCPAGTVYDDINNSGCVPLEQCACIFNSTSYSPGTSYSTPCSTCVCTGAKWQCENKPCPASCSVEGGCHIATYDQTHYTFNGDCDYVLSRSSDGDSFTILAEMRKCGLSDRSTCLKGTTMMLNGGETVIAIKPSGSVFVNNMYTQLPVSAANVTIFQPSSFYIIVQYRQGIRADVQLTPLMQVSVSLDPSYKGQTCGLCGNFNDRQADDFQTISGAIEGTATSFANTWKTRGSCDNVKNVYEDPCSFSVENEQYANYWCGLISDPSGPFSPCHAMVNPDMYKKNCMFDTCNCERSEDCMCAALSSYVRVCATKGILLTGWRSTVCSKYMDTCPKTMIYTYATNTCQPTCRSLSEPDVTCSINFVHVDGCVCPKDYYLDDTGACVPVSACPCYYKGSAVPAGEVVHDNGILCTCTLGKLSCIGTIEDCTAPMVYVNCKNATSDTQGAECQKSCQTLDMACYGAACVPGCVCPDGLVSDGKGGCIKEEDCPCIHNDAAYQPGDEIKVKCNTCICKERMWQCTDNQCLGTCTVYGDGNYITFDGQHYKFNGNCEYTLAQDYHDQTGNSSRFRVLTENIPCGTTGTTCSKSIKISQGSYELILADENFKVEERAMEERAMDGFVPYKVTNMGIHLVIEINQGLTLVWDKKTTIFIKLSKDFEGQISGLCGNYDGNGMNDFTTRSRSVVADVFEFANSWRISQSCPDAQKPRDACSVNPYRKVWAQKQCSILNSQVFSTCHGQVDPSMYYEACVSDSCACDSGGDCECFCTAVAAYARACGEAGVCVSWRTPSICPIFCDYYNPKGECEWHYKACGSPCLKTCRNPAGKCKHELGALEGCYPSCPASKPYFDEDEMKCVAQCDCYDDAGNHFQVGDPVPTFENCQTCVCGLAGTECEYQKEACHCEYNGKMYKFNQVIYRKEDDTGGCYTAICEEKGIITKNIYSCPEATTSTPSTRTTRTETITATTTPSTETTSTSTTILESTGTKSDATSETTENTCFCHVNHKLFSPGQIIYNKTIEAGCFFYAVCNDACESDEFIGPCPHTIETTTPKPEPETSATTTAVVPTTSVEGCPPKKTNEVWINDKCEEVTCYGNNITIHRPMTCPELQPLTCANGFPPVTTKSEDGCCDQFECQCVCSGWGDPHYITFDGVYYTFQDNCTYVLVQEINPKYSNFRVLVDNYYCAAADGLSCPQSIFIYYKSNEIMLTRMLNNREMKNMIRLNNQWVTPGFTTDGIIITSIGINMNVEIPEIGAYISFSGLIFMIKLPFSKFAYNTEGQCGTCSNNIDDECRMPGGRMEKDCTSMAPYWRVNSTTPGCVPKPPVPSTSTSTTTTSTTISSTSTTTTTKSSTSTSTTTKSSTSTTTKSSTPTSTTTKSSTSTSTTTKTPICSSSFLCDIILSNVFVKCHKVIPPKPYYDGCLYDACRIRNDSVPCSSLEVYASLCSINGICVDWRGTTGGRCPYNCSTGKVYKPCGPIRVNTCENKQEEVLMDGLLYKKLHILECIHSIIGIYEEQDMKNYTSLWGSSDDQLYTELLQVQVLPVDISPVLLLESTYTGQIEGCFCPDGTTLFNTYTDTCVKSCACVGPDGMPKAPGETWTSGCKTCTCETMSLTVQCQQLPCPKLEPIICTKEGFIPVTRTDPKQPCCMKNECRCDINSCVTKEKTCPVGYQVVSGLLKDDCCPTFSCRPLKVCVVNDIAYQPGQNIPQSSNSCQTCACTEDKDPKSEFNLVKCSTTPCNKDCAQGFQYREVPERCCGRCVQVECTMKLETNEIITIKVDPFVF